MSNSKTNGSNSGNNMQLLLDDASTAALRQAVGVSGLVTPKKVREDNPTGQVVVVALPGLNPSGPLIGVVQMLGRNESFLNPALVGGVSPETLTALIGNAAAFQVMTGRALKAPSWLPLSVPKVKLDGDAERGIAPRRFTISADDAQATFREFVVAAREEVAASMEGTAVACDAGGMPLPISTPHVFGLLACTRQLSGGRPSLVGSRDLRSEADANRLVSVKLMLLHRGQGNLPGVQWSQFAPQVEEVGTRQVIRDASPDQQRGVGWPTHMFVPRSHTLAAIAKAALTATACEHQFEVSAPYAAVTVEGDIVIQMLAAFGRISRGWSAGGKPLELSPDQVLSVFKDNELVDANGQPITRNAGVNRFITAAVAMDRNSDNAVGGRRSGWLARAMGLGGAKAPEDWTSVHDACLAIAAVGWLGKPDILGDTLPEDARRWVSALSGRWPMPAPARDEELVTSLSADRGALQGFFEMVTEEVEEVPAVVAVADDTTGEEAESVGAQASTDEDVPIGAPLHEEEFTSEALGGGDDAAELLAAMQD